MKPSKHMRLACVVALALLVLSSAFVICSAASGATNGSASAQNANTSARRRKTTARRRRARKAAPVAKETPRTFSRHVFSGGTAVQGEPATQVPYVEPPPPPAPTPAPKKTIVAGGVLNGKAISKPTPEYPAIAKAARAQGTVVVQIVVGEDGRVMSASAVSGHPLLQQAAVAAARQARFSPTLLSGQPVKVSGVITYNFVLQ